MTAPIPPLLVPHRFPSFMMEYDIHTVLDGLTLLATLGVVFCMMLTEMKASYQKEQDVIKFIYVVRL